MRSDYLFWLDPWSNEGSCMAQRIRPYTHDLRHSGRVGAGVHRAGRSPTATASATRSRR